MVVWAKCAKHLKSILINVLNSIKSLPLSLYLKELFCEGQVCKQIFRKKESEKDGVCKSES